MTEWCFNCKKDIPKENLVIKVTEDYKLLYCPECNTFLKLEGRN